MTVTIIGLGLIGGSLALELRKTGKYNHFIGVDRNPTHAQEAVALNIVDICMPLEKAVAKSDIVLLAIPVDAAAALASKILEHLGEEAILIDAGSTKAGICGAIQNHPNRNKYVAAHPIAGTENTGPSAAHLGLFRDKTNIICEPAKSNANALATAQEIFNLIGMRTIFMEADEHDRHIAYVSHLSHITSFTLGLTVLDMEKDEQNIFNMAGSGFESTVRLAKSNPDMWAPIFEQNADPLSKALEEYIARLQDFKAKIDQKDREGTYAIMHKANDIRRVLNGILPVATTKN